MKRPWIIAAVALLALLLTAGMWQLFVIRLQHGDSFEPYSSHRRDPMGTAALFTALQELEGVEVLRNHIPYNRADFTPGDAILIAGYEPWRLDQLGYQDLKAAVEQGARVILVPGEDHTNMFAQYAYWSETTLEEAEKIRRESLNIIAIRENEVAKGKRAKPAKEEDLRAWPRPEWYRNDQMLEEFETNFDPMRVEDDLLMFLYYRVDLEDEEGREDVDNDVLLSEIEYQPALWAGTEADRLKEGLPADLPWKTLRVLVNTTNGDWELWQRYLRLMTKYPHEAETREFYEEQVEAYAKLEIPQWETLYATDGHPVVLRRKLGKGEIIAFPNAELLSNEAMLKDRQTAFLAWLFRDRARIVFDEVIHGNIQQKGVVGLMREYPIEPLALGLAVLLGLFCWAQVAHILPDQPERERQNAYSGHSAQQAFYNLVRRSLRPADLLQTCWQLWQQDCRPKRSLSASEKERVAAAEKRLAALAGQAKTSETLQHYQHLSRDLGPTLTDAH